MQSYENHTRIFVYARAGENAGWKLAHGNIRDANHAREVADELKAQGKRVRITETNCRILSDD